MMQRTTFTVLALVAAATLAGCSATAPAASATDGVATAAPPAPPASGDAIQAQVQQRSDAYWQARRTADVAAAYALTSPGYRAVHTLEQFRLDYGAIPNLTGGDIVSAHCEQERCELVRAFKTSSPLMPSTLVPISISEVWVQQDGQWWRFIE